MENKLVSFILQQQREGGYSFRQLAKMADLSHTHVIKILNSERDVSFEFCVKMAKVFNRPVWEFLQLAGLTPQIPDEVKNSDFGRILLEIFSTLGPEAQQEVIEFAKFKQAVQQHL